MSKLIYWAQNTKMVKKTSIKVGIIGCGWFGNFHLDNLLQMENVNIVALYNRGMERLEKTGKKVPKARLYQDYKSMLTKEKMDAVILCITPDAHGEIEELCCKKKISLYIEKPIALSVKTADAVSDAIKFSNIITSVGYQERYSPPLALVKEIVEKEPVGLVTATWIGDMPVAKWRLKKAVSGGQVVEQTTHIADMMRYLFGEVATVYATGTRNECFGGEEHDVEDCSSAILRFKNGVTVNMLSGCYSKGSGKVGFEIYTPNFRIEYNWGKSLKIISGEKTEEIKISADNHIASLKTFIDAVKSGDRYDIRSNYDDAIETLRVTLAVNESMEEGKVISL